MISTSASKVKVLRYPDKRRSWQSQEGYFSIVINRQVTNYRAAAA